MCTLKSQLKPVYFHFMCSKMDRRGLNLTKWIEVDQMDRNRPNWTKQIEVD